MQNHDPFMVQAQKVVVDILKQETFRDIAKYILKEEDLLIEEPRHLAPNPIHSQPGSDHVHLSNAPSSQNSVNYSLKNPIFKPNTNATEEFPQPPPYAGQQPLQRAPAAELSFVQPQTEAFPFMNELFTDQVMFIDPLMAEFDQTLPLGVGLEGSPGPGTQTQGDGFAERI